MGVRVQYRQLFDILENRIARRAVVGSGSYTFFHKKRVRSICSLHICCPVRRTDVRWGLRVLMLRSLWS